MRKRGTRVVEMGGTRVVGMWRWGKGEEEEVGVKARRLERQVKVTCRTLRTV